MNTIPSRFTGVGAAVKSVCGTAVAVPLLLAVMPAAAQSSQQNQQMQRQMQEMRQQMQEMNQRFEQLKANQGKSESSGGMKVGDTTFEVSGYIKADAIYDFEDDHGVSLGPSDAIGTKTAKGTDHPGDQDIGFTANQSRLRLTTTTPTAIGDVGGYIEADFYGNGFGFSDSPSPRIRRVYLTVGNWLIGRDWTTFSDFNYGTTLNFYGPQAQIFERQTQIRYTMDLGNDNNFAVALESPDGDSYTGSAVDPDTGIVTSADGTDGGVDGSSSPLPDLTARYQGAFGPVSFQVAGVARYLRADIADSGHDAILGWGLDAGATWALPTGTTLMGSVAGGEGIGKYLYAPAGGFDAYVDNDGNLQALQRWGFIGTVSQELTSQLTANFIYGKGYSESPSNVDYDSGAFHDNSSTIALNLLYNPVDQLTFGIEYNRSYYEQQDGVDADANNVQVSAIYDF